jgi:hypothetical protein
VSRNEIFNKLQPHLPFSVKTLERYNSDGLKAASLAGAGKILLIIHLIIISFHFTSYGLLFGPHGLCSNST